MKVKFQKGRQMTSQLLKAGIMNANPVTAQIARVRVKYIEGSENQPLAGALVKSTSNTAL